MTIDSFENLKILLIDDMPMIRKLISTQLKQIGVKNIFEADDAHSGLKEVIRTRPHLILCDIHMKNSTGFEFLKALRAVKIGTVSETPVMFVTSDSELSTVRSAIKLQPNGYLIKPVNIDDLKQRLQMILKLA